MNNSSHYSPPSILLAGIMAFLPMIAVGVYFLLFFSFFFDLTNDLERHTNYITDESFGRYFVSIFLGVFLVAGLSIASLVYYLVIVSRNPALNSDMRLVWILLIIFGGFIASIVYLFMYVVPQSRGDKPLV